jgi:predicted AlkP superfamily pyrophosphatase or phosphodiesterase
LFVRLKKYYYPGGRFGSGHGSPEDYDRHVPVILAGPGVTPGRYGDQAGPEDIAPTLERLLGLEERLEPDTRVLAEALAR